MYTGSHSIQHLPSTWTGELSNRKLYVVNLILILECELSQYLSKVEKVGF